MSPGDQAEALIAQFSIRDARDIDLDAIAFDAGVRVEYQPLEGCEATLVGFEDRAVATVRPSPIRGRERFSLAHELGHWKLHRGRTFRCRLDDPDENLVSDKTLEKQADTFAAHLLMPAPLFNPALKTQGNNPGFGEIADLATQFDASLLATSLRLTDVNRLPVVLACYTHRGLRWHKTATDVPRRWWLRNNLDEDSFAYDLMTNGTLIAKPRKQPAETWFENDDADSYEVFEHCVPGRNGEVLVLIYLSLNMLDAAFDPSVGNRRYNEHGSYVTRKKS